MIDRVTDHAVRVVTGAVPSGRLHFLACKRHLDDIAKQNTEDFPYYWDASAADEVLQYAETLTIAEGDEPKPVVLIAEQAFDIGATFGWKKTINNKRRFRRRYKSVARQNGKTFENGIMGTYIAGFGGYSYGKLFTVATKKRQARLAWEEMQKFIGIDPDLNEYFKIKDYKSLIQCLSTGCTIEALSKEAGLDDGFRSIFSSVDELHQHKDNKIYKAIYNGTRSLPETLVSMITTRGDNLYSFGKEMDDYAVSVLEGMTTAEDFFVDIYALDKGDDIWNPNVWYKANPFLCNPRNKEQMKIIKGDAQTAKDMGGADLRDFVVKSLNLWMENTEDRFIDSDSWKACGTDDTLEKYRGKECWVGLDLSSGGDLTTFGIEIELPEDHFYLYSHSFMPRGRQMEHIQTDLAPYDLWEQMGLITVTGTENDFKNDYGFIIKKLKELKEKYELTYLGIAIDPHNADGVLSQLEDFGCPVIVITQSAKNLNDATQDLRLLIKSGQITYDKSNELLTWSVKNAKLIKNSFDEVKIDKRDNKRYMRIDPVDSLIDAHCAILKQRSSVVVDVDDEMDKYLQSMGWK